MTFRPGAPKPVASGRKAGTPNRATAQAQEIAVELGVDPFHVLLLLAGNKTKELGLTPYVDARGQKRSPSVPLDIRQQAAANAARHLYPTIKSIDATVTGSGPWDDIMAMSPEDLERRRAEIDMALNDDDEAYSPPSSLDSGEQSTH